MNISSPGTDLRTPPEPYSFEAFRANMRRFYLHEQKRRRDRLTQDIKRDLDYGRDS